jgi:hypothetical protein
MCVKANFYRRLPREQFRECQQRGGLAQMMLMAASEELRDCIAWFGYCGDAKALAVDLRAGYEITNHKNVLVKWCRRVPAEEGQALIDSVAAIGPF